MNLAEQIKNEIRQENPFDAEIFSNLLREFFSQNPIDSLHLRPWSGEKIEKSKSQVWYEILVPTKSYLEAKRWLKDNGFGVWDVLHSCTHEVRYTEVTLR